MCFSNLVCSCTFVKITQKKMLYIWKKSEPAFDCCCEWGQNQHHPVHSTRAWIFTTICHVLTDNTPRLHETWSYGCCNKLCSYFIRHDGVNWKSINRLFFDVCFRNWSPLYTSASWVWSSPRTLSIWQKRIGRATVTISGTMQMLCGGEW